MMHDPKPKIQIENRCRPSPGRMTSSFDKIIDKLNITLQEQKKLKVLKRRWLKKSAYAKRKRKCKLTNLTEKQQELLERRTRVCELKNVNHLRNKDIADILNVISQAIDTETIAEMDGLCPDCIRLSSERIGCGGNLNEGMQGIVTGV